MPNTTKALVNVEKRYKEKYEKKKEQYEKEKNKREKLEKRESERIKDLAIQKNTSTLRKSTLLPKNSLSKNASNSKIKALEERIKVLEAEKATSLPLQSQLHLLCDEQQAQIAHLDTENKSLKAQLAVKTHQNQFLASQALFPLFPLELSSPLGQATSHQVAHSTPESFNNHLTGFNYSHPSPYFFSANGINTSVSHTSTSMLPYPANPITSSLQSSSTSRPPSSSTHTSLTPLLPSLPSLSPPALPIDNNNNSNSEVFPFTFNQPNSFSLFPFSSPQAPPNSQLILPPIPGPSVKPREDVFNTTPDYSVNSP